MGRLVWKKWLIWLCVIGGLCGFVPSAAASASQLGGLRLRTPVSVALEPVASGWWWRAAHDPAIANWCHPLSALQSHRGTWFTEPCVMSNEITAVATRAASRNQLWAVAPRSPRVGELVVSELNWAGSYQNDQSVANDEWLELSNTSSTPLWLGEVQLEGILSTQQSYSLPNDAIMAPYSFWVLGRLSASGSALSRDPDWLEPQLRLPNDRAGIQVRLATGELLDSVPSGAWQHGRNDTLHHQRASAQRMVIDPPYSAWSSWSTASASGSATHAVALSWLDPIARTSTLATPWQAALP